VEEASGRNNRHFFWASRTDSAVIIDTYIRLLLDAGPIEMELWKKDKRRNCTPQDNDHWPEQTVSIIGPCGRMRGRLASESRYCCTASLFD
jgi:hypothetical protein